MEAVTSLVSDEDRDNRLISRPELNRALSDTRCYLYLAFLEAQTVGLLSAYRFPDLAAGGQLVYLYDIEVAVSQRRKGVGAALIETLATACRDDAVRLIWAGTERENSAACNTFETTGAALEGDAYVEYEWVLED